LGHNLFEIEGIQTVVEFFGTGDDTSWMDKNREMKEKDDVCRKLTFAATGDLSRVKGENLFARIGAGDSLVRRWNHKDERATGQPVGIRA
jgi:hypothetical protein